VPAAARITDVDVATLTDFLGSCPPFDALGPDELARIVAHAVVERYDAGAVILDAFDSRVDELFVMWQGRVDIRNNADRLSELPDETEGVPDAPAPAWPQTAPSSDTAAPNAPAAADQYGAPQYRGNF
jgi:hypothetical protein